MAQQPTDNTAGLTAETRAALDSPPTTHEGLISWVREIAELTTPDRIHWADGSEQEWKQLTDEMVDHGTLVRLDESQFPNSFAAFSDPDDVARVEERTFICTKTPKGAGPTNNWEDPAVMKETTDLVTSGHIDLLAFNQQTSTGQTKQLRKDAENSGVSVVEFSETLPDGKNYQEWMRDNIDRVSQAVK